MIMMIVVVIMVVQRFSFKRQTTWKTASHLSVKCERQRKQVQIEWWKVKQSTTNLNFNFGVQPGSNGTSSMWPFLFFSFLFNSIFNKIITMKSIEFVLDNERNARRSLNERDKWERVTLRHDSLSPLNRAQSSTGRDRKMCKDTMRIEHEYEWKWAGCQT